MSEDMLKKLDDRLAKILGSQEAAKEAVAEMEKKYEGKITAMEARLLAQDQELQKAKAHSEKMEADFNAKRFRGPGDDLLHVIPEEFKGMIEYVKTNPNVDPKNTTSGATVNAIESLKTEDPVKYIAVASWFHSKLMTAVSQQRSNGPEIVKYNERAEKLMQALGAVDKASLAEGTANMGADFVPTIVEAVLGRVIKDNSVVRRSGPTVIQMTSQTHNLPKLDTNFSAYWALEAGTISDSGPATAFSAVALTAKKNTGLATASIELLQDSVVNINDFFLVHLGEMMARNEDNAALNGTNHASNPFVGIVSATGTNAPTAATTVLSLARLMSAAYVGEDQSIRDGGVWYVHPWIVRDALQLVTGSAGSPWLPMIPFNNQGQANTLLGWPVYATSVISRNLTSSTSNIYFGNPKGIVMGDRMGTQFDIDPYGLFTSAQIRMRVIRRTGIAIWVPGKFTYMPGTIVAP